MKRITLIVLFVFILGVVACASILLLPVSHSTVRQISQRTSPIFPPTSTIQPRSGLEPSSTVSPLPSVSQTEDQPLQFVNPSLPIIWQAIKTSRTIYDKPDFTVEKISGKEQDGDLIYRNISLHELSNVAYLQTNGWSKDIQIAADSPMGSEWGYSKIVYGKKRVVIFSYTNTSFALPPAQTTCPCKFSVSVFLSDPF